jgi:hypothetical protein
MNRRHPLFTPIPAEPLAFLRIALAGCMLYELIHGWRLGWLQRHYLEAEPHFSYLGFEWVKPLPDFWMRGLFVGYGALTLMLMIGLAYRVTITLVFLVWTWLFLAEAVIYLNHWYLTSLLLFMLLFMPAHRAWSIDRYLRPTMPDTAPAWTVLSLRILIGLVYFYAGVAKLDADWLAGRPLIDWVAQRSSVPVIGPWLKITEVGHAMAIGGTALDLFIVPALLWSRTRLLGLVAIGSFHALNAILWPIGAFPVLGMAAALMFLPAERFVFGAGQRVRALPEEPPARIRVLILSVFLVGQVVFPLRHWLYPGNASWTEEGHMFAWRMMLRDKPADAVLLVFDDRDEPLGRVVPAETMFGDRSRKVAENPEFLVQYAKAVAARYRAEGRRVHVHALVVAALNGRPPQLLIDPSIDLAAIHVGWKSATWIVPLGTPMPEFVEVRGRRLRSPPVTLGRLPRPDS